MTNLAHSMMAASIAISGFFVGGSVVAHHETTDTGSTYCDSLASGSYCKNYEENSYCTWIYWHQSQLCDLRQDIDCRQGTPILCENTAEEEEEETIPAKYEIDLEETDYDGVHLIQLKTLLRKDHGPINLSDSKLVKISFLIQSRDNNGRVALMVAGNEVDARDVRGKPRNFGSKYNYRRVTLENSDRDNNGVWRLKLNGTIKIEGVEIFMEES